MIFRLISLLFCLVAEVMLARAWSAEDADGGVEQPTPAVTFEVLRSSKIDVGGRSLFLNRVAPPIPPTAPLIEQSVVAAVEPDPAPQKKHETLSLSATVFDRQITELRWFVGGREFRIFSNIDFNLLTGQGGFETEDTVYSLILGLGNETRKEVEALNDQLVQEGWPEGVIKRIPARESFSSTRSEYVLADADPSQAPSLESLAALDALHAFFDANRTRLADEYARGEKDRIERERWLKEHPPKPKDTVIHYWIGEGATRALDKRRMGGRP